MKSPYQILGVDSKASAAEIKRAYRKLAKELHPDLNPGDKATEQRFKEVSQAYGLLSDAEKRARFDKGEIDASGQETGFGKDFSGGFYQRHAGGREGAKYQHFHFGGEAGFDDIISDLFGGQARRTRQGPLRGADVRYSLTVDFLTSLKGGEQKIALPDGRTLSMKIPAGVEDGKTLRLKSQGQAGPAGGPRGDVLVEISVTPHPLYRREGLDLHLELPISLPEAVLGASLTLPLVQGRVALKVPPGSNSGKTLRLKGKGVAGPKGTNGDLYLHLRVDLPDKPDAELENFLRDWAGKNNYDPRRKVGLA